MPKSDPEAIANRSVAGETPAPDSQATVAPQTTGSARRGATDMPEVFGRYRILKQLGKGGMGAVYLAQDTQLERQVALKVPHFSSDDGPEVLERFYREARAAATLHHPNICPVFDVGAIDETHYLTMAYIEGKPLNDFIRADKGLPGAQAAALLRKIALALDEAHKLGIVHRDLKPANIMINQRKEPVIMDFGLARRADKQEARITKSGAVVGTPAYMSPEQVGGKEAGPPSDLYSLGVILYEMLTGKLPFDGPMMAVLSQILLDQPKPPSEHRPEVDKKLEAICLKAMAKDPNERYASMADFAAALAQFLRGAASGGSTATMTPPSETQSKPPVDTQPKPVTDVKKTGSIKPVAGSTTKAPVRQEIAVQEEKTPSRPKKPAKGKAKSIWQKPWPWLGIGGAVAAVLAIVLLSGVIFRVQTKNGVVVLNINEPGAQVFVDGELKITLTSPTDKKPIKIEVPEGNHVMKIVKGGFVTETKEFTLRPGTPQEIRVTLRPDVVVAGKNVDPPIKDKEKVPVTIDQGWTPWFTTADLSGWDGFKQNWRVEQNQLIGSSEPGGIKKNTYLISKKRYKDFELKCQVRITGPKANSGVQIRSDYAEQANFILKGPQADIGDMYWGSLYGELYGGMMQAGPKDIQQRIKQDDFNDFYIKCVGNTVQIKVNGETTVEGAFPKMPVDGYLGWQIHSGEPMTATFRNVLFRELTAAGVPLLSGGNPPPPGFTALFNGKDLTGWKKQPDGEGNWTVENGYLVGRGSKPNHLFTERNHYEDFHFLVECRINAKGNSGQVFRAQEYKDGLPNSYEAQIDSGSHGNKTGSLYVHVQGKQLDGVFIKDVLVPPDTWYTQEVIAKGNHIVIKVNDKIIADFVDKNNTYRRGYLALQLWDPPTVVEFRKIWVKELKPMPVEPVGKDFTPLFNGTDLTGWVVDSGDPKGWRVDKDKGELVANGVAAGQGWLITERSFEDFVLRLEFRLAAQGNSGVTFRAAPNAKHAEIQILDDSDPKYAKAPANLRTGSLWKIAIDQPAKLKPLGQWNSMEVQAQGRNLRVSVNGAETLRTHLDRHVAELWAFNNATGRIGLQNWAGGEVRFRNIEVKELPKQ